MPPILSEQHADKEVIKSLGREIARLKGKLQMHAVKLFKDSDGSIKQAIQYDTVTRDEIVAAIEFAQKNLDQANQALADFDAFQVANPQPELPAEDTTQATPDATPVEQPVVDPAATVPAEQPATPAEQLTDTTVTPAADAAPTVDAAPVASAEPAPTTDPTPDPVTIA